MSEIKSKQATLNIGTIGHVAHGKSTIVRAISGISTIKFKAELERNITIKLGYANAKIFKCDKCPRPDCYSSFPSSMQDSVPCSNCGEDAHLIRHVSFVDCPGHDVLMATMLNGTAIMDAALLLVAANEPCPQPQTREHLCAVEIMNLSRIIIVQNKIDVVTREQALEQHDQIKAFLKSNNVEGPIIPTAGQLSVNINAVLDFIVNQIPEPVRSKEEKPRMIIIRSFDINKPGTKCKDVVGGVIGGSLITGSLRIGEEIEIRPGLIEKKEKGGQGQGEQGQGQGEQGQGQGSTKPCFVSKPFITKIVSLQAETNKLEVAYPGGLIGVGTEMDPFFCKGDKLVGQVMGKKGSLPPVYSTIEVEYLKFSQGDGKDNRKDCSEDNSKDGKDCETSSKKDGESIGFLVGENILLNIGSTTTGARIREIEEKRGVFELTKFVCCEVGERIAISKKMNNNWRLVGHGVIRGGEEIEVEYPSQ